MAAEDARSLPADVLEVVRRKAVAAVQSGASRSEVARMFGVSRKAVSAWVLAYRDRGDLALRPRTRGRRPGEQLALTTAQQARTISAIIDGTPDEHGLPHPLWTRQAIVCLVSRDHGVDLSPGTIGQYLARWALLGEPAARGRRAGTGLPGEAVSVSWTRPHTWGDVGRGGNLLTGFRRYYGDVNVLAARSAQGLVSFQARRGPFDREQVAGFPARLRAQLGRSVGLVVGDWPAGQRSLTRALSGRTSSSG